MVREILKKRHFFNTKMSALGNPTVEKSKLISKQPQGLSPLDIW